MAQFPVYLDRLFGGLRKLRWWGKESKNPFGSGPNIPTTDPAWQWLQRQLEIGYNRQSRYHEYEQMDKESVEIHAALNYYADDATQLNTKNGKKIWVESPFPEIQALGTELFEDRLKANDHVWGDARGAAKRGDRFNKLIIDKEHPEWGVMGWRPYSVNSVRRIEDQESNLFGFKIDPYLGYSVHSSVSTKQDPKKDVNQFHSPWDFVHFRLLGDEEDDHHQIYGLSMIEAARPVWKRLKLLEEMLMLYRSTRAVDRMVYYVDVGDMSPERAVDVIKLWRRTYKRDQFLNPGTMEFNHTWNPHAIDQDIFWAIRQGVDSRVERLHGSVDVNGIADLEWFANKVYLAIMVPREYLSGEGSAVIQIGGGMSLAQKDIRYARTIQRLQAAIIEGYTRALEIHLALLGIDPERRRFTVKMSPVSNLDELQKLDVLGSRMTVASQFSLLARDLVLNQDESKRYILSEILGLESELIARLMIPPPQPQIPPGQEIPGAPPVDQSQVPPEQQQPAQDQQQIPLAASVEDIYPEYKDLFEDMKRESSYTEVLKEHIPGVKVGTSTGRYKGRSRNPLPGEDWSMPDETILDEMDSMLAGAASSFSGRNGKGFHVESVTKDSHDG